MDQQVPTPRRRGRIEPANEDERLRMMFHEQRIPEIYEALFCGLAVMTPDDPEAWLLEKLENLSSRNLHGLSWDMFIDQKMRSRAAQFVRRHSWEIAYGLFPFRNDPASLIGLEPSPEQIALAISHRNNKLVRISFNAILQFHLLSKQKRQERQNQLVQVMQHYRLKMCRKIFAGILKYTRFMKRRRAVALQNIIHVSNVIWSKQIFAAWHQITVDARKTREYFEQVNMALERGENPDMFDELYKGEFENKDRVAMLPDDPKAIIFGYLNVFDLVKCASVSRAWKLDSQSGAVWHKIDFSAVRNRIRDRDACKLLQKYRAFVEHLNLRGCLQLGDETFLCISECRNLQDLNLSECTQLTDEMLKIIVQNCDTLLYLNLSCTEVTDAGLRYVAAFASNLLYLSLAYCSHISDKGLEYFDLAATGVERKLEYLDLSGCSQLTIAGYQKLFSSCPALQTLNLNDLSTLDDACIATIVEACHDLSALSLKNCPRLTDTAVLHMCTWLQRLTSLKIDSNNHISDAAFKHINKAPLYGTLKQLQCTDLVRLTDVTLKLLSYSRTLTVLNLADCVRLSDAGLRCICESPCAPLLRELNLSNCIRVGDVGIAAINKRCTSLSYLVLRYCEHITESGIETLSQRFAVLDITGCNLVDTAMNSIGRNRRLRELRVSECYSLTDVGIQKFTHSCKQIERLDLSMCKQLTDMGVKTLAFACRMLSSLNLAGCKQLTDLSIQYLSGVCRYLTFLDISGCIQITDRALKYVKKSCKQLRHLRMLYCPGISFVGAAKYTSALEKVELSHDEIPSYFGYDLSGTSLTALLAQANAVLNSPVISLPTTPGHSLSASPSKRSVRGVNFAVSSAAQMATDSLTYGDSDGSMISAAIENSDQDQYVSASA